MDGTQKKQTNTPWWPTKKVVVVAGGRQLLYKEGTVDVTIAPSPCPISAAAACRSTPTPRKKNKAVLKSTATAYYIEVLSSIYQHAAGSSLNSVLYKKAHGVLGAEGGWLRSAGKLQTTTRTHIHTWYLHTPAEGSHTTCWLQKKNKYNFSARQSRHRVHYCCT